MRLYLLQCFSGPVPVGILCTPLLLQAHGDKVINAHGKSCSVPVFVRPALMLLNDKRAAGGCANDMRRALHRKLLFVRHIDFRCRCISSGCRAISWFRSHTLV
jgi:hypothetical protein